jgi:hydroxyethylthiazole kinase-like uncharacterized protein yjeF
VKIITTSQMRQVEQDCAGIGLAPGKLMENAGKAFAEEVRRILGNLKKQRILMLIGPGNNGGDGLVASRHLNDWGAEVSLCLFGERADDDQNFTLAKERDIDCLSIIEDENMDKLASLLESSNAVIDALFGIGQVRPFRDTLKSVLDRVSDAKRTRPSLRIIALDLPSGLNADTGAVDPACLYADNTVTLGFPKTGLLKNPGVDRVGSITVADIGIPAYLVDEVPNELIDRDWARSVLPPRPLQANKGSFGRVLVIAGSINYIGAAYLASNGALRVGAGLVTLATATTLQPVLAAKLTEVTHLPLPEAQRGIISPSAARLIRQYLSDYDTLLMGCGLGQSRAAVEFVENTLLKARAIPPPLVLDADALNTLARIPNWWQRLSDDAILTPHPGEMARLVGNSVADVQRDRPSIAKRAAATWNKTIVLKGAYTVIATPDGRSRVCPSANPGLASAGTGDVLSGVIAGLVAQGMSFFNAASLGVFLHSEAGELVRSQLGEAGMLASDLLPALPPTIKQLKTQGLD